MTKEETPTLFTVWGTPVKAKPVVLANLLALMEGIVGVAVGRAFSRMPDCGIMRQYPPQSGHPMRHG